MFRGIALTAIAAACCASPALAQKQGIGIEALTSRQVIPGGLVRPVGTAIAPGDTTRMYIYEKQGRVRVWNTKTEAFIGTYFLNIDGIVGGGTSNNDERGLLGMAFDPDYQNNGYFYVYFTNNANNTEIRRYSVIDADVANPAGSTIVLNISQPYTNHNGGWIGFGPDGYLYVATGDGGSAGDPGNRAQDITNQLLGKMLRIDVSSLPYTNPGDNPFVGVSGDDEIWSYGLRNPWRCSFDRETGDLYIADVGQNQREEINFEAANSSGGINWGWRCREGQQNYNFGGSCGSQTLTDPFHQYAHTCTNGGYSITGGFVYRGCNIRTLGGTYFFADYVCNNIWSLESGGTNSGLANRRAELVPNAGSIQSISSFGEDARGELYILDQNGGEVFKIEAANGAATVLQDLNCDLSVNFDDLVETLASWGPCVGCAADTDGDDDVDFDDLVALLAAWT